MICSGWCLRSETGRTALLYDRVFHRVFHGIPRTEKSVFFPSPPDRIFLYQRNIEALCDSEAEVRRQIRATLLQRTGTLLWAE